VDVFFCTSCRNIFASIRAFIIFGEIVRLFVVEHAQILRETVTGHVRYAPKLQLRSGSTCARTHLLYCGESVSWASYSSSCTEPESSPSCSQLLLVPTWARHIQLFPTHTNYMLLLPSHICLNTKQSLFQVLQLKLYTFFVYCMLHDPPISSSFISSLQQQYCPINLWSAVGLSCLSDGVVLRHRKFSQLWEDYNIAAAIITAAAHTPETIVPNAGIGQGTHRVKQGCIQEHALACKGSQFNQHFSSLNSWSCSTCRIWHRNTAVI
jgi:hypothetical protein